MENTYCTINWLIVAICILSSKRPYCLPLITRPERRKKKTLSALFWFPVGCFAERELSLNQILTLVFYFIWLDPVIINEQLVNSSVT